jgi:hypothetical protein
MRAILKAESRLGAPQGTQRQRTAEGRQRSIERAHARAITVAQDFGGLFAA